MKVAMIGLGKLGLPVACAMTSAHDVYGYDIDKAKLEWFERGDARLFEPDMNDVLMRSIQSNRLHFCRDLEDAIGPAEIVFIAVPTPSRSDHSFNTDIVVDVLESIGECIQDHADYKVIAVISTVLPGTCRKEFLTVLDQYIGPPGERYGFCYNAQFIAMGTVIEDFLNPEFVLIGEYDKKSGQVLKDFYTQIGYKTMRRRAIIPVLRMTLENAEMVKLIYNVMIGLKIVYANTIMEMCDKIPFADCDVVTDAIKFATDRLISPRYLTGGMGDGGGCHPRDQRALWWFGDKLQLSVNPFEFISEGRESQSNYLVKLINNQRWRHPDLPIVVMGARFKPETNLTIDSPSLLLVRQLFRLGIACMVYDPVVHRYDLDVSDSLQNTPMIHIVTVRDEAFLSYPYVPGSVIIDVWRMFDKAPEGCELIWVGK